VIDVQVGAYNVSDRLRRISASGQTIKKRALLFVPERIPTFFVVTNTRIDSDPLSAGIDYATMNFLEQMSLFSYERF
tara:strand:- start:3493 stop:3723 length:231 start_codon:yes stop_codon:yes gene_type:complete